MESIYEGSTDDTSSHGVAWEFRFEVAIAMIIVWEVVSINAWYETRVASSNQRATYYHKYLVDMEIHAISLYLHNLLLRCDK
jgi:hypothetical protein